MQQPIEFDAFNCEANACPVTSVEEEYEWLAYHALLHFDIENAFPQTQKLTIKGKKNFDILTLVLPGGLLREYWFDISSFYGKH